MMPNIITAMIMHVIVRESLSFIQSLLDIRHLVVDVIELTCNLCSDLANQQHDHQHQVWG